MRFSIVLLATKMEDRIGCFRLCIFLVFARVVSAALYIPYQTPQECIQLSVGATTSWYFDTTQLKCVQCSQSSSYQRTSADG